jgi:hypothetical protein
MEGAGNRLIVMAVACVAGLLVLPEARAQGTAVPGYPVSTSPAANMSMGMNMGMGFMPIPYGMFGTASLSRTDAAALGMTAQSAGGMGMAGQSNNIFANPLAAPMLYGSPYPMSQRQAGLMMLAGQSQQMLGGIGSGQLSGVRSGTGGQSRGRTAQQTALRQQASPPRPGGLAARYFNRTTPVSRYPQSYYNRQNRYFPQVTR